MLGWELYSTKMEWRAIILLSKKNNTSVILYASKRWTKTTSVISLVDCIFKSSCAKTVEFLFETKKNPENGWQNVLGKAQRRKQSCSNYNQREKKTTHLKIAYLFSPKMLSLSFRFCRCAVVWNCEDFLLILGHFHTIFFYK